MKIAFAGFFAIRLAELVRVHLSIPCEVIEGDEEEILPCLADADVLVSMGFTRPMAEAAPRLRLVQVPGAGLDRIDRGAMRPGLHLANAYGHEAGIAEYIIGAMLALTRSFGSLDASLRKGRWDSQWAIGTPMPPPSPEFAGTLKRRHRRASRSSAAPSASTRCCASPTISPSRSRSRPTRVICWTIAVWR